MAHTFDTKYRFTGDGNPVSDTYTCGSGTTLLVVGMVVVGGIRSNYGAPTYNGIPLKWV